MKSIVTAFHTKCVICMMTNCGAYSDVSRICGSYPLLFAVLDLSIWNWSHSICSSTLWTKHTGHKHLWMHKWINKYAKEKDLIWIECLNVSMTLQYSTVFIKQLWCIFFHGFIMSSVCCLPLCVCVLLRAWWITTFNRPQNTDASISTQRRFIVLNGFMCSIVWDENDHMYSWKWNAFICYIYIHKCTVVLNYPVWVQI